MNDGEPLLSATLMLLRQNQGLEVLMIKRNEKISFAGGAWVFPGGRVHKEDLLAAKNDEILASKYCALRETYEETGIFFDGKNQKFQSQDFDFRKKIESDTKFFYEELAGIENSIKTEAIHAVAEWTAPKHIHKRFRTWFFTSLCESEINPIPDMNEAIDAIWIAPSHALEKHRNGEMMMIFPTLCNLYFLMQFDEFSHIEKKLNSRNAPKVAPEIIDMNGNKTLLIAPDIGYPESPEEYAKIFGTRPLL